MRIWAIAIFCLLVPAAFSAERPNVLLICVDDLKPALACFGDPVAHSPNIDRLASRAVRFERAYCNQAVCSPSRNALLTGLRPQTLGIYDLATNFRRSRPDAITLPQYFKRHGYRTEGLGKIFHVGHGNHDDADSWSVPHWQGKSPAYVLAENKSNPGPAKKNVNAKKKGAAFEAADVPDNTYHDGALADEAIRRIESAKQRPDEPFFLAVGFVKPHLPFVAPKKYWDLYDRAEFSLSELLTPPRGAPEYAPHNSGELRQYRPVPKDGPLDEDLRRTLTHGYYAAMNYMDAQVGRVLDALEKAGLADETIIVLWGDHGWHLGDHGMWCKHSNYEQAARIPLLVVAPDAGKGAVSQALVETVDIYPTLCELAGLPLPDGVDGASFAQTAREPVRAARDHVTHVYPRVTAEKKPVLGRAIRTERYRLVEWKEIGAGADTAELELYDYASDPAETENLAAKLPEVVAELRALLARQPEARAPSAGR